MPLTFNPFTGTFQFINKGSSSGGITTIQGNSGSGSGVDGVFQIVGSGDFTTSVSGNILTIGSGGGGFQFFDKSSDFTAAANNGYFCTSSLTALLPNSATQGDKIIIVCDTDDEVNVQSADGQYIRSGSSITSSGGLYRSSQKGNCLTLYYRESDSTWLASSTMATWNSFDGVDTSSIPPETEEVGQDENISFSDKDSDFTAVVNTGYFLTSELTMTMPSSPSQGDLIIFCMDTTDSISIDLPDGQYLRIGNSLSSSGGIITSNTIGDSLTLYFREATSTWFSTATEATFSVL